MKANELMINDWVHIVEPDNYHGYDAKVKIINDETGYITVFIDGGVLHDVLCDDLTPVPLTKEILEKNGFGFVDVHKGYYCQHGGVWTGWWINSSLELAVTDYIKQWPVYLNIPDTNIEVKYVHELQHSLKLCGIEKDIEM